jgi:hypothetical protein
MYVMFDLLDRADALEEPRINFFFCRAASVAWASSTASSQRDRCAVRYQAAHGL